MVFHSVLRNCQALNTNIVRIHQYANGLASLRICVCVCLCAYVRALYVDSFTLCTSKRATTYVVHLRFCCERQCTSSHFHIMTLCSFAAAKATSSAHGAPNDNNNTLTPTHTNKHAVRGPTHTTTPPPTNPTNPDALVRSANTAEDRVHSAHAQCTMRRALLTYILWNIRVRWVGKRKLINPESERESAEQVRLRVRMDRASFAGGHTKGRRIFVAYIRVVSMLSQTGARACVPLHVCVCVCDVYYVGQRTPGTLTSTHTRALSFADAITTAAIIACVRRRCIAHILSAVANR